MRAGDDILLFSDGPVFGWDFQFRIEKLTERMVSGEVTGRAKNDREPRVNVTLCHAFIKKTRWNWYLKKGRKLASIPSCRY